MGKRFQVLAILAFFLAYHSYSHQVGDWVKLDGEYYFVLDRTDYMFDEGRAFFLPASLNPEFKNSKEIALLDYCPRMRTLEHKMLKTNPLIVTEAEVSNAVSKERVEGLKNLFAQILQERFSWSKEEITTLFKVNQFTEKSAIDEVIRRTGRDDIFFTIIHDNKEGLEVTFTIQNDKFQKKQLFEFWKSMSLSEYEDWDLHVVPREHPIFQVKKGERNKSIVINGDTDILIGGKIVHDFNPPKSALDENYYHRGWSGVHHPYKLVSDSITLSLNPQKLSYETYLLELTKILNYALRKDGNYIEISGGFNAAYEDKKLYETKKKNLYRSRGCEHECVYLYNYLKNKNQLEGAHVPKWMYSEGWIDQEQK